MRHRFPAVAITIATLVAAACLVSSTAAAQGAANGWTPPRTADGQPDIQGFWDLARGGPAAVNVETGMQTADSLRVEGWTEAQLAARKPISAIVDPADGKIPYQPWALKRRAEIVSRYSGDEITGKPETVRDVTSELLCVIGAPRLNYFAGFQVTQAPGYVVMTWERSSDFRIIPLSDRPHLPDQVKLHTGDSRGRWEGNTLVVDTTNMNDWSWFDSKGSFHSDAMSTVERFTFVDAKTIKYTVTVTDPKAFTRPMTMAWSLRLQHAPAEHYEIYETACVEGERALDALLPGVRR
jgi:hypothetical protein